MINRLVLLSLSIIIIESLMTFKSKVAGDLVSISGIGTIIAIVDTTNQNQLTILKKNGQSYDKIKIKDANIWLPSTYYQNLVKSEHIKSYKPQLSYDGSQIYYISSITGYVVMASLSDISDKNPYLNKKQIDNRACWNVSFSNCSFTLQSSYKIFLNIPYKFLSIQTISQNPTIQYFTLHFDQNFCNWEPVLFTQPIRTYSYTPYELGITFKYLNQYCYLKFNLQNTDTYAYNYNYSNYSRQYSQFCNSGLYFTLYCYYNYLKVGIYEDYFPRQDGSTLRCYSLQAIQKGKLHFKRYAQVFNGFLVSGRYSAISFSINGLNYLQLYYYSFGYDFYPQLKITQKNNIKSFDLNSEGLTIVYLNDVNQVVIVQHTFRDFQIVSEEGYDIKVFIWLSFSLILLLFCILISIFIYLCIKYRNRKTQLRQPQNIDKKKEQTEIDIVNQKQKQNQNGPNLQIQGIPQNNENKQNDKNITNVYFSG